MSFVHSSPRRAHRSGASRRARVPVSGVAAILSAVALVAGCSKSSTAPAPTAASLALISGGDQSGTVGTTLTSPVVLQVKDQHGNIMKGVVVSLVPAAGSGGVPTSEATTDSTGDVSVQWTLGIASGTDSLTASVAGAPSVTVVATAMPNVPAGVIVVSGDGQSGAAGSALPLAITVKVVDRYGNPVPNVMVTFTDDENGTFANASVVTDGNGMAQDLLTLGPSAGMDDVTVMVSTTTGPIAVTLHETAS